MLVSQMTVVKEYSGFITVQEVVKEFKKSKLYKSNCIYTIYENDCGNFIIFEIGYLDKVTDEKELFHVQKYC